MNAPLYNPTPSNEGEGQRLYLRVRDEAVWHQIMSEARAEPPPSLCPRSLEPIVSGDFHS